MKRAFVAVLVAFVAASTLVSAQRGGRGVGRGGGAGAGGAQASELPNAAVLPIPQPAAGFVQPKTPWGDPDIQGFWPGVEMAGVPLQRPARFGTRNTLTDEEFAQRGSAI